ncbi:sugar transferase [Cohnella yongneupensis]|uniref:Sugar transferase n=1 Tax=Cohnella yongneupensis TaxID=425006 RepID=A0ABW0R877_9BACL
MKRTMDLLGACVLLVLLSWLIAIVALLIRAYLGPRVIFKQQRAGLRGKPFNIYKFRSLTDEKDGNGQMLTDEQRLTRFGSFIRKYSLDELPQLINVIKGDISLVGPRPLPTIYLPLYSPVQARRHEVMPGITGWAQVNGRNAISWETKFELDVWYVDHRSLWLDIKILGLTAWGVIGKKGISAEGYINAPVFRGNKAVE